MDKEPIEKQKKYAKWVKGKVDKGEKISNTGLFKYVE